MSVIFIISNLVWTGLLAAMAEALTRRRVTPHFAQRVWRFAALFMVLPWAGLIIAPLLPAVPVNLSNFPDLFEVGPAVSNTSPPISAGQIEPARDVDWPLIILIVLTLGWTWRALAAQLAQVRLSGLTSTARPCQTVSVIETANRWAKQLNLRKAPDIAIISADRSPFLAGFLHPVIYLPDTLQHCNFGDLITAHECVHLARGDLITRPLERIVADLIWFSPFAWLARKRLDYWREAVCDAETVKLTEDPVSYSRALANTARMIRPAPALPVAAFILNSKRKTLPMRIKSILEPQVKTSRKRLGFGFAALMIAAPLALAQGIEHADTDKAQIFRAPVMAITGARIVSSYGLREDPFTNRQAWHSGVDITGPKGTDFAHPIYAPTTGEVIFAGSKSGYGNTVDVQLQPSNHIMRFAQLESISVQAGERITPNTEIGLMGSSGRSTGRHLHLEYIMDGKQYDPEGIEGLILVAPN